MAFTQVITPNPNIPCKPGWCLEYVAKAFGVFGQGVGQPSATAAWNYAVSKGTAHTDRNFDGLWVPVYFTFIGEPNGHIVAKAPDNSIYSASSSTSTTPVHHTSIETLNQYYGGKLGLLGWSEDLNGIKIVKESDVITTKQVDAVIKMGLRREPTTEELNNPAYANDAGLLIDTIWVNGGEKSYKSLSQIKVLNDKLTAANAEIVKLKAQPPIAGDTALDKENNAILIWIKALLSKIFK